MIFGHEHGLNKAGPRIEFFCDTLYRVKRIKSRYEQAIELMRELSRNFVYVPNTTNVSTTAEEAFSQGYGVCQDYAHIYISFLHLYLLHNPTVPLMHLPLYENGMLYVVFHQHHKS